MLRPHSWYKRFVLEGARQHRLPEGYIASIEAVPDAEDPNKDRETERRKISC
jgi:gamma-glutamylcyclotransferase